MRKEPTSWFAGTYDAECEEDRRLEEIEALRKFYRGFETLDSEGKSIGRVYLGRDLLWEKPASVTPGPAAR